jgi:fructokinase|tara:strand:+ start:46 stop:915 length:870 start_codon:yes stop_codon:yes gene_type:complete
LTKIVCFGEVLWDIYPDRMEIGGAPFNVYYRLHSLGNNVKIISSIGDDDLGLKALKFFKKNNLNSEFLSIDKYHKTGQVKIQLKSGEPSYSIVNDVAWDFIPSKKEYTSENFDYVIFGSLAIRNDKSFETLKEILRKSKFKILDLNIRQNYYQRDKLEFLLQSADYLKINMDELMLLKDLFNIKDHEAEDIAQKIFSKYNLKYICLTNGSVDSFVFDGNEFINVESLNVESIDNVGAGDNFLASFINEYFIKKNSLKSSLKIASIYGAITTTKKGGIPSINKSEINSFL